MNEKEQNLLNSILQVVSGKEEQIDEQMDKRKFRNELKELESLQKTMDQNDVQYILGEILKRTKDIQNGKMQFVNSVMQYSYRLDKELSHTRDISKKLNTLMEKFNKKIETEYKK